MLLGLERAASDSDIKRAYRRLARKYHPDINPGDRLAEAQFRQIAEAYETLIDPDSRRRYDSTGSTGGSDEPATYGFEGFDFSISVSGSSASTFGDLFADVLDHRTHAAKRAPFERRPPSTITIRSRRRFAGRIRPPATRQDTAGRATARLAADSRTRCFACSGASTVKSRAEAYFRGPACSAVARGARSAPVAATVRASRSKCAPSRSS